MQLILRRTLEEIFEHNQRESPSPALLRIVNVVSPRSWRFSFLFDADQTTEDGSIPELFDARSVTFTENDETAFEGEINFIRGNVVDMPRIFVRYPTGIRLRGYMRGPLPPFFSSDSAIRNYLYSETWFGSEFIGRAHSGKECVWSVYGNEITVRPHPWRTRFTDASPKFECELDIELNETSGRCCLAAVDSQPHEFHLRHSRLGAFPPVRKLPNAVVSALGDAAIVAEVNEPSLHYQCDGGVGPVSEAGHVVQAVVNVVEKVLPSEDFKKFRTEIANARMERAADALRRRQEVLRTRPRLQLNEQVIGYVPRSENEVVVLLSKIEMAGGLPLALFRLVEYTPRAGIDALADLQIDANSRMQPLAPIEIEFHFESFIRHRHPIQQVAMIVCWTFQVESIIDRLPLTKEKAWLYRYATPDGSCPVLVLSRLPGLTQETM
jgi:hypothetical protein